LKIRIGPSLKRLPSGQRKRLVIVIISLLAWIVIEWAKEPCLA